MCSFMREQSLRRPHKKNFFGLFNYLTPLTYQINGLITKESVNIISKVKILLIKVMTF